MLLPANIRPYHAMANPVQGVVLPLAVPVTLHGFLYQLLYLLIELPVQATSC
jgi:hypothetical protein